MKRSLMGFEKQGDKWIHQSELTEMEAWTLDTIGTYNQRSGRPLIPAGFLAEFTGLSGRDVREMINHLIDRQMHGLPICSMPGLDGGYLLAGQGDLERLRRSAQTHLKRVITGGRKARALGASAAQLGQSMVQLTLGLPDAEAAQVVAEFSELLAEAGLAPSHKAVTAALAKYAGDPQHYAQEIGDLAQQFGDMFVSKLDLERVLSAKARELVSAAVIELSGVEAGAS